MLSKEAMHTPTIQLTEGDAGRLQTVEQLDLDDDDVFKTLGIHMTISGNETAQIADMKKKSNDYTKGILFVSVTNFEAWTRLFTIWLGKLNYPLAVMSMPRHACEKIQSKAINASLSKYGFSRKTSRTAVFDAFWFGGLGWRHIYFEEDILHILTIIKHLRIPGPFQSVLRICLNWWYQVIASVSFLPLYMPAIPLNYTDSQCSSCLCTIFTCI